MKKVFAFILTFFLFANFLPAYAANDNDEKSMEDFYSQMDEIILNCDNAGASSDNIENLPTNRLIVKTKTNESLKNYYDAIYVAEGYDGLHILQYENEVDTAYAYNKLKSDNIEYVEYDYYLSVTETDLDFKESDTNQQNHTAWNSLAVNVNEAFDYIKSNGTNCDTVTVAVIDTGIYANHTHFSCSDRIIENQKYTFKFSVLDEDYNKVTVKESSLDDKCFHGTAVSSVVYDNTMNNVIIEPYRISNTIAMPYSIMFEAFDYAVSNHADIINISAEGGIPNESKTLFNKITEAVNSGIIVVVAAGNSSRSTKTVFPACHPDTITVSSTNEYNNYADFSNYGASVDVAAPGTNILCPTPRTFEDEDKNKIESCDSYSTEMTLSGTSFSAPLVAAAAATLKSIVPDITPSEVKRIIKETAYVPEDWEESCGGKNYGTGIVNFYNMVKAVLEPEYSSTPTISINSDNKFEITSTTDANSRIYYTLDGTIPTIDNHLIYNEPLNLRNKYASKITAVCHENGKLIGEPVVYDMITYDTKTIFYKWSDKLSTETDAEKATWRSNNSDIVSVDCNGNITGVSKGDTKITCTLPTGEKIIWKVNVKYSPLQAFFVMFFFGFLWI